MNFINMLIGLFVGENSKKRQISVILGLVLIGANWLGYVPDELMPHLIGLIGIAFGLAVSTRLTKMHNAIKK